MPLPSKSTKLKVAYHVIDIISNKAMSELEESNASLFTEDDSVYISSKPIFVKNTEDINKVIRYNLDLVYDNMKM